MTINEIRQKLGSIVADIFTVDFEGKFNMIRDQLRPGSEWNTVDTYSEEIDSFVLLAASMAGKKDLLAHLARAANPLVVYGVFFRYHIVTQSLVSSNQKDQRIMPSSDNSFLTAVLIDLWKVLESSAEGRSM